MTNSEIKTQGINHKKLRHIINKLKERIKGSEIIKDMFKEYDVSLDEIDLIPICFAEIPVSARTDHGVIYLNYEMLNDDILDEDHYLVHEITHFLQQTTGNKPTKGSDDGNYLDNPVEKEGFKNQVGYIADNKGEKEAKKYVTDLLDYHEVEGNKNRKSRFEDLMELADRKR